MIPLGVQRGMVVVKGQEGAFFCKRFRLITGKTLTIKGFASFLKP